MANWDVFHGDRLELERDLTTSAVREALARGDLLDDDLVRPAGTTVAWTRLADMPQLLEPAEPPPAPDVRPPAPVAGQPPNPSPAAAAHDPGDFEFQIEDSTPVPRVPSAHEATLRATDWEPLAAEPSDVAFPVIADEPPEPKHPPASSKTSEPPSPSRWRWDDEGDDADLEEEDVDFVERQQDAEPLDADGLELLDDETDLAPAGGFEVIESSDSSSFALPVSISRTLPVVGGEGPLEDPGALAEMPEPEEFSLSRSGPMTVEELDLAPMVDVAFQLVLFFMVAAQTILYKTLEIPKPSTDQTPAAVTQGRSRNLEDLQDDYILLEIDESGTMKLDRQPVTADMATLVERLRSAREATRRKAMLLSAAHNTPHRFAVLAYDAANEIGLGIAVARPTPPQGPAPKLHQAQPPAAAAVTPPAAAANSVPN